MWGAVALISLATAAHQGWSANLFTLATDMFPRQAIGSVVGLGGFAGAVGGMMIAKLVGYVLQMTGSYTTVLLIAGVAYLTALAVVHILTPRLEPVRLDGLKATTKTRRPHEEERSRADIRKARMSPCRFLGSVVPVGARADAEFRAERAVEVRHVAEAAVECDLQDFPRSCREPHGGFAQPRSQHVLVWRYAGQPFERAKKVVRAEAGFAREASQCQCGIGIALDAAYDPRHSRGGARRRPAQIQRRGVRELDRADAELDAQLFPSDVRTCRHTRTGARDERRELAHRRQADDAELASTARDAREALEVVRRVAKRQTAIAGAVIVPALEALSLRGKKHRPRCHQLAGCSVPEICAVLKSAGGDNRHAHV